MLLLGIIAEGLADLTQVVKCETHMLVPFIHDVGQVHSRGDHTPFLPTTQQLSLFLQTLFFSLDLDLDGRRPAWCAFKCPGVTVGRKGGYWMSHTQAWHWIQLNRLTLPQRFHVSQPHRGMTQAVGSACLQLFHELINTIISYHTHSDLVTCRHDRSGTDQQRR